MHHFCFMGVYLSRHGPDKIGFYFETDQMISYSVDIPKKQHGSTDEKSKREEREQAVWIALENERPVRSGPGLMSAARLGRVWPPKSLI